MGWGQEMFVDRNRGGSGSSGFIIPELFQMLPTDKIGVLKYN